MGWAVGHRGATSDERSSAWCVYRRRLREGSSDVAPHVSCRWGHGGGAGARWVGWVGDGICTILSSLRRGIHRSGTRYVPSYHRDPTGMGRWTDPGVAVGGPLPSRAGCDANGRPRPGTAARIPSLGRPLGLRRLGWGDGMPKGTVGDRRGRVARREAVPGRDTVWDWGSWGARLSEAGVHGRGARRAADAQTTT